jgi:hypothetical protein
MTGSGAPILRPAAPTRVSRFEYGPPLGDARTVPNVGAGTGSCEPPDRDVTAVEPSPAVS